MAKTSELTGVMLNYWVARAEGICLHDAPHTKECGNWGTDYTCTRCGKDPHQGESVTTWKPSTNWAQGGPIIERDQIMLQPPSEVHYNGGPNHGWKRYDHWRATVSSRTRTLPPQNETQEALNIRPVGRGTGETALIAAMRAKVASHYGDEVPDDEAGTASSRAQRTTKDKED